MLQPDRTHIASPGKPRELEGPALDPARGLTASLLLVGEFADEGQLPAELAAAPERSRSGCPVRGHSVIAFASSPSISDDGPLFVVEAASNPIEIR